MKAFRDRRQFELEIVRHIIPDPGAFEEALEGLFLILSNRYRLCCRRRTPRSSRGMLVAIIDQNRRTSVIGLGLRVVNLRSSSRQRHKGARLSEAELWGVPAADGWSRGRCGAWLSSLGRSWVLIASITGIMIVIGVHGMVGSATDLCMCVLVPSLPCRRLAPQRRIC